MPMTARIMPVTMPRIVEAIARISVVLSPTRTMFGSTSAMACQSKKLRVMISSQHTASPSQSADQARRAGDAWIENEGSFLGADYCGRYWSGMGEPGNHFV